MKTIKLSSKSYNGNSNVFILEDGENIGSLHITHSKDELKGFSKSEKESFIKEQILSGLSQVDFFGYVYDSENLDDVIHSIMIYAHN